MLLYQKSQLLLPVTSLKIGLLGRCIRYSERAGDCYYTQFKQRGKKTQLFKSTRITKGKGYEHKIIFSHHLDLPLGVKSAILFWIQCVVILGLKLLVVNLLYFKCLYQIREKLGWIMKNPLNDQNALKNVFFFIFSLEKSQVHTF